MSSFVKVSAAYLTHVRNLSKTSKNHRSGGLSSQSATRFLTVCSQVEHCLRPIVLGEGHFRKIKRLRELDHATAAGDRLARDVGSVFAGQERGQVCNVLRLPNAARRVLPRLLSQSI